MPLTCIDQVRMFTVTVPGAGGKFELGEAQARASVTIQRGKTERAQETEVILVQPAVFVDLADSAQLDTGSGAVTIALTVACPVGANGQQSFVASHKVRPGDEALTCPSATACDTRSRSESTRLRVYAPGTAHALTFADVEHDGMSFSGVDKQQVQIGF